MIKVSIIVPIYNVEIYLEECLDSILNQTLKDIEIICVNDGSTDSSLTILKDYAERDNRIKIIDKKNSGYGHSMNVGIDNAIGKYIGIVEPDDYIKSTMYEELYNLAETYNVDLIKADFYRFTGSGKNLKLAYNQLSKDKSYYNKVLDPKDNIEVFKFIMNTWSGIYNRDFLNKYQIRHNETPGASFQDNGFWFQTFCWAKRVYFVNKPFYMNRRDNVNSSVHNREKVYCMNEEYKYIKNFLERNLELKNKYMYIYSLKKYHNYNFTMTRIGKEYYLEFLRCFSKEFKIAKKNNELSREYFTDYEWKLLNELIKSADDYYKKYYNGLNFSKLLCYLLKIKESIKKEGFIDTLKKIKRRFFNK